MKPVFSAFLLLAVAFASETAPRRATSAPPAVTKVSISATFGGGVSVQASASGTTSLSGSGALSAGTTSYPLRVTAGSVKQGRYVSLTGTITAGGKTTTFQLDGERVTGTIKLTYKGAKGNSITLAGVGKVSVTGG